ncbi:hypothetical protein ACHWQZ_G015442 [Mnemiopsis leidyi]
MYGLSGVCVLVVLWLVVVRATFLGRFRRDDPESGVSRSNHGNQGGNQGGYTRIDADVDPECFMNSSQLIADNGYIPETHSVTTEDGYILQIFRVRPKKEKSPVAFLQHGLTSSSDTFLLNLRSSFPFILHEQGYDVWLGNVRGNIYCMNHTSLSPQDKEFWDFSFQEMGEIDLPAMVDYVLKVTGQKKIFYTGHSQGTEMGFLGFSSNPDLASKISLFTALAPIARISYAKGLIALLKEFVDLEGVLYWLLGNGQFDPPSEVALYFATKICPEDALTRGLCETLDALASGFDISNINQTRYPIYRAHDDQSTSTKDIIHWAQLLRYKRVQKFDYGSGKANMARYNQTSPPLYDISKMRVPTILVAGGNDWLGDTRDVMWLIKTIYPSIVKVLFIDKYNHDDYVLGMDAPKQVYSPVLEIMGAFVNGSKGYQFLTNSERMERLGTVDLGSLWEF